MLMELGVHCQRTKMMHATTSDVLPAALWPPPSCAKKPPAHAHIRAYTATSHLQKMHNRRSPRRAARCNTATTTQGHGLPGQTFHPLSPGCQRRPPAPRLLLHSGVLWSGMNPGSRPVPFSKPPPNHPESTKRRPGRAGQSGCGSGSSDGCVVDLCAAALELLRHLRHARSGSSRQLRLGPRLRLVGGVNHLAQLLRGVGGWRGGVRWGGAGWQCGWWLGTLHGWRSQERVRHGYGWYGTVGCMGGHGGVHGE